MLEILVALLFSVLLLAFGLLFFHALAPVHKPQIDLIVNTLSDADTPELLSVLELRCYGSLLAVVKQPDEKTINELQKQYKIQKIIYI